MQTQRTSYGWLLRIDTGEELFETLRAFAVRHDVRAGTISGIGAVGEAELGCFVRSTRTYVRVLETHGWGDTCTRLNEKAAKGERPARPAKPAPRPTHEIASSNCGSCHSSAPSSDLRPTAAAERLRH